MHLTAFVRFPFASLLQHKLLLKKSAPTAKFSYNLTQSLAREALWEEISLFTAFPHPGLGPTSAQGSQVTVAGVVFGLVCLTATGKKSYYI